MKKFTIIAIILFLIFSLLISGGIIIAGNISNNLKKLESQQFGNVNLANIKDGSYIGSYNVFPISAKVKVTVESRRIVKIDILEHKNAKGESAEAITDSIIDGQTLDVDVITGATYSSKIILLAVQDALERAIELSK